MSVWVYFLLGSNEGDREAYLKEATDFLIAHAASGNVRKSSVYETAAWGIEDQPSFLNLALGMETERSPAELLLLIRRIEQQLGRQRKVVWGQRTLDVDILLYCDLVMETPELHIPHPRLQDRRFALTPLAEIAGAVIHPVFHKTVAQLLEECTDQLTAIAIR